MATLVSTGQLTIVDQNDGQSVAEISVYARKSGTAPTTPTGGSYNFTTRTITVPSGNVNWYDSPAGPPGTDTLYISIARATYDPSKGTTTLTAWTTPIQYTGKDGTNGTDAVIVSNSNNTHQITAYANGLAKNYTGSSTTISVKQGGTDLTWVSYGTTLTAGKFKITNVSVAPTSSITLPDVTSLSSATIPELSGMQNIYNTLVLTYTVSYITSTGVSGTGTTSQSISKISDPAIVTLSAPSTAFIYNASGNTPSPASTTVTASASGLPSTVRYEFLIGGAIQQAKSTTATYLYTPQASYSNMPQTVVVKVYADASDSTVYAQSSIGMTASRTGDTGNPGANAVVASLSRDSKVFTASLTGVVSDYTNSGTDIYVFDGATAIPYDGVGTSNNSWKITAAGTNITASTSFTDMGTYVTVGNHNTFLDGSDSASVVYTISGKTSAGTSFSFTKTQSFSKSKKGDVGVGTNGSTVRSATVYLYYQTASATQPAVNPTYSTNPYDFTTGVFTTGNPSVWKQTPPTFEAGTAANKYWYMAVGVSQTDTNNQVITLGTILLGTSFTNLVTFTSLSTPGSTTIDGGNITTGLINSARINTEGLTIKDSNGVILLASGIPTDSSVFHTVYNWDFTSIPATSLVKGRKYIIETAGSTSWTSLGAAGNTKDTIFIATGAQAVVNAGSFSVGTTYEIVSIGTTSFTAIGANSNTIGTRFTATGAGSGSGTAFPVSIGYAIDLYDFNVDSIVATTMPSGSVLEPNVIRLTSLTTDPILKIQTTNFRGKDYDKVRMRIRKRSAGTAELGLYYETLNGHTWSGSYYHAIPDTMVLDQWTVLEWDMSKQIAGGNDWNNNVITGLRFDIGNATGSVYDIDWIAVGRYGSPSVNPKNAETYIANLTIGTLKFQQNAVSDSIETQYLSTVLYNSATGVNTVWQQIDGPTITPEYNKALAYWVHGSIGLKNGAFQVAKNCFAKVTTEVFIKDMTAGTSKVVGYHGMQIPLPESQIFNNVFSVAVSGITEDIVGAITPKNPHKLYFNVVITVYDTYSTLIAPITYCELNGFAAIQEVKV